MFAEGHGPSEEGGRESQPLGTNDPAALKTLFDAGVDFPLVDKTSEMMEAAKALGIEPVKPIY